MQSTIVKFAFFANYFIGILAIALSVEAAVQLQIPFNSVAYYVLLFAGCVVYYTYAYSLPLRHPVVQNVRTDWYRNHAAFIKRSQLILSVTCAAIGLFFLWRYYDGILSLPFYDWCVIAAIPLAATLYYGLVPQFFFTLNLRDTGWIKPFIIGFEWACCVTLLPMIFLQIQKVDFTTEWELALWLFIKNWMFCTVNAIMFDMKDYADDANRQLKTFVVRIGLRKTIFFILIPLVLIGILSLTAFAWKRQFGMTTYLFNLFPFICLLIVAYSLHRRKAILFYLIVIDGLLLVKAICGIAGMHFLLRR